MNLETKLKELRATETELIKDMEELKSQHKQSEENHRQLMKLASANVRTCERLIEKAKQLETE